MIGKVDLGGVGSLVGDNFGDVAVFFEMISQRFHVIEYFRNLRKEKELLFSISLCVCMYITYHLLSKCGSKFRYSLLFICIFYFFLYFTTSSQIIVVKFFSSSLLTARTSFFLK